jgi:hypothetical protein
MTTPKVTEIIRNGNPVGTRPVARQIAAPTTAARNPSR